jgi:hypothetical protein
VAEDAPQGRSPQLANRAPCFLLHIKRRLHERSDALIVACAEPDQLEAILAAL